MSDISQPEVTGNSKLNNLLEETKTIDMHLENDMVNTIKACEERLSASPTELSSPSDPTKIITAEVSDLTQQSISLGDSNLCALDHMIAEGSSVAQQSTTSSDSQHIASFSYKRSRKRQRREYTLEDFELFKSCSNMTSNNSIDCNKNISNEYPYYLRIPVSNLAALTGFNPYKILPQLALDLVYQGEYGQALMRYDAKLLGLELVSEEKLLLNLANKAGVDTVDALNMALQVKDGQKKIVDIEMANKLKKRVQQVTSQAKTLTQAERRLLQEATRSAVDTGFGTFNESNALDAYQQQYKGLEVYNRNAEVIKWGFTRADDSNIDSNDSNTPTLVPLTKQGISSSSNVHYIEKLKSSDEDVKSDDKNNKAKFDAVSTAQVTTKIPESAESPQSVIDLTKTNDFAPELPFLALVGSIDGMRDELVVCAQPDLNKNSNIAGNDVVSVNNSTTENTAAEDEFDKFGEFSIQAQSIIVECKHRMKTIRATIPLYEQIQAVAYCLMYGVTQADVVQVLRTKPSKAKAKENNVVGLVKDNKVETKCDTKDVVLTNDSNELVTNKVSTTTTSSSASASCRIVQEQNIKESEESTMNKKDAQSDDSSHEENFAGMSSSKIDGNKIEVCQTNSASNVDLVRNNSTENTATQGDPLLNNNTAGSAVLGTNGDINAEALPQLTMTAIRVSVDDPIMQHSLRWDDTILPRLRSFAEAVYKIRSDDGLRYKLLLSVSDADPETNSMAEAWDILHKECPWLLGCDTAYYRT